MNHKTLFALIVALVMVGLFVSIGAAQSRLTQGVPTAESNYDPQAKQFLLTDQSVNNLSQNPNVTLGDPGLSFAYTTTLGTTDVPYLYDHEHLYTAAGLGASGDQIWIAEYWGQRVLKFNNDGSYGGVELGGAGTPIPGVSWLTDVTIDADGNAWVAVAFNSIVSVFDPDGNFIKQLGDGGDMFFNPSSVAFDSHGNVYIADGSMPFPWPNGNQRIEIYSSTDEYINTIGVTGESGSDNDHFNGPHRIAIDNQNRLYVADRFNQRVQIFDVTEPLTPTYTATLGVTGECGSDNDHLCKPQGVAVDDNFIYVADTDNRRVQIFDISTRLYVATILGDCENSGCADDVAVDGDGNIYMTDGMSRVQQYDSGRNFVRTYGVTDVPYLTDGEHFYWLASLATTPGQGLLVLEWGGSRLIKLDAQGVMQWSMGKAGITGCGGPYALCFPNDVTADALGNVYLSNGYIRIYDSAGTYIDEIGSFNDPGAGEYQFNNPTGVAVALDGTVYVADTDNQRVQVYDSQWVYYDTLGETGVPGDDDAHFNKPTDVVVDSAGNIYVADQGNNRVQVFDATLTYLRTLGEAGDNFGQFQSMQLAVDAQDRLYVLDDDSDHVQVFDVSGAFLTSIAGEFQGGLAVSQDGTLYLARSNRNDLQVFTPGVPGWKQVNINGFGDRWSSMISGLVDFNDQLYAGASNGSGAQIWRLSGSSWVPIMTGGFGRRYNSAIDHLYPFDGQLYAGTVNEQDGGEVWRSGNGLDWTNVAMYGFGNPLNCEIMRFTDFNGAIYASTWSYTNTLGAEIWRSTTGNLDDWSLVVSNGFNEDISNEGVVSFETFNGYLYAGTYNSVTGGEVWRSFSGDLASWTQVNTDGFSDSGNRGVSALAGFGEYLYAATYHSIGAGVQVWRCQICNGSDWTKVGDNGFGTDDMRRAPALEVVNSSLYIAMGNTVSGIGLEIWRTKDGLTWEPASLTGFGDANNQLTYFDNAMTVFHHGLYIGTVNWANGGEVWQLISPQLFLPLVVR